MGRMAVADDVAIISAGLALRKEGLPVTGWALKQRLGGGRSDRLIRVWESSPEARLDAAKVAKGRIPTDVLKKAQDAVTDAAQAALAEIDLLVSGAMAEQDRRHANQLSDATKWAEGIEETSSAQMGSWAERERIALDEASRAREEAKAIPGLRQEVADLREMLKAARDAEVAARAEAMALATSRDEMAARLAAAEDRERAALERAARAEGMAAAATKKG